TTDFGSNQNDAALGVAIQSDGRIVAGGASYASGNRFALARYHAVADNTPPQTFIDGGPAEGSTTDDATPTFAFHATEPGSRLQCAIDAGAFFSCTSPRT